jgi:hypothetical protein
MPATPPLLVWYPSIGSRSVTLTVTPPMASTSFWNPARSITVE